MKRALRWWPLIALAVVILAVRGMVLEGYLKGAEDELDKATIRAYRARVTRLEKSVGELERRSAILAQMAAMRSVVSVTPPVRRNVTTVTPAPRTTSDPPVTLPPDTLVIVTDTMARVTINDTAYVVPARVGLEITNMQKEIAQADSLRMAVDSTVPVIRETVSAADTAIAQVGKKPGFLRRVMNAGITALCAGGGAALGSAVGDTRGAVVGAVGGVALCAIAR